MTVAATNRSVNPVNTHKIGDSLQRLDKIPAQVNSNNKLSSAGICEASPWAEGTRVAFAR
jgi:hypothetical protein